MRSSRERFLQNVVEFIHLYFMYNYVKGKFCPRNKGLIIIGVKISSCGFFSKFGALL